MDLVRNSDKGEGVQKPETFVDVICAWPFMFLCREARYKDSPLAPECNKGLLLSASAKFLSFWTPSTKPPFR